MLLVNVGNAAIFTLASVCIILIYLPIWQSPDRCSTGASRAGPPQQIRCSAVDADGKKFSLARSGIVVNLLAVIYRALMVVNLFRRRGLGR